MVWLMVISWCTMNTLVLFFKMMFREVVSVGIPSVLVLLVNLLGLGSLDEHLHSNLLRFACYCRSPKRSS
jgi:hypothetical protein